MKRALAIMAATGVDFMSDATEANVMRFDEFELDTSLFELRRSGVRIAIEPQAFDLLVFLAKNRERTVTKEEIFKAIWGDRIVSEAALSSQISAARRALGDDGTSQRMIATLHGRGFRFVRPIQGAAQAVVNESQSNIIVDTKRPWVAVLPFTNQNRDPDDDYFADGITEDIITSISKHRWMSVVARNPAFAFRNSTDSIRVIGEKLNAHYVVTGNVRKEGARFRITVQLLDSRHRTLRLVREVRPRNAGCVRASGRNIGIGRSTY